MSQKYPEWYELPKDRWVDWYVPETPQLDEDGYPQKVRVVSDSQKSRIYNAENQAMKLYRSAGYTIREFTTKDEVQQYLNDLLTSKWVTRRFGKLPYISVHLVLGHRRSASACIRSKKIVLPPWAMNEVVVLHEVSHILMRGMKGVGPPHGRLFARILLEVTTHMIGRQFRFYLKQSFKKSNIKHTPRPVYSKETLVEKRRIAETLIKRRA